MHQGRHGKAALVGRTSLHHHRVLNTYLPIKKGANHPISPAASGESGRGWPPENASPKYRAARPAKADLFPPPAFGQRRAPFVLSYLTGICASRFHDAPFSSADSYGLCKTLPINRSGLSLRDGIFLHIRRLDRRCSS